MNESGVDDTLGQMYFFNGFIGAMLLNKGILYI